MVEVILKKSTVKGKKYDAIFPDKKVSFGSSLMKIIQSIRMTKDENHTLKGTVPHNRGQI